MIEPVKIHEAIGAGIRAARLARGWRQQDASYWFRFYGLATWTPGAVSQVEAGVRKPGIGELVLAARTLGVPVASLIPDTDELIDLGAGAAMSASAVRAALADMSMFPRAPGDFSFPGDSATEDALARAGAERDRRRALIQPILDRSSLDPWSAEMHRVFLPPTEAESRAAVRLRVEAVQVRAAALVLWSRDFELERDSRAGTADDPKVLQAQRGHATRAMLAELRELLTAAYPQVGGRRERSHG
jgi:transcriptional regulator with XRE-family HTH domain